MISLLGENYLVRGGESNLLSREWILEQLPIIDIRIVSGLLVPALPSNMITVASSAFGPDSLGKNRRVPRREILLNSANILFVR